MTKKVSGKLIADWLANPKPAETVPEDFWQEDTIFCPKDYRPLFKHYFAGTFIGIDNCKLCRGFWIDGSEFKAIWEQVAPNPCTII